MIKQRWEDCTIGFYCPSCNAELVADSQNEEMECDCGLRYYLAVSLKVTPPNTGLQADGRWACRNCGRENDDGFKFCSRCNTARR
jgi:uncharacterized protein YbaR (Trm112 family)